MDEHGFKPIRKRMERWEGTGTVRFVTFSCYDRRPLLGNPAIRDFFADQLATSRLRYGFEMFALVVMPEHVHLLVRPRKDAKLGEALRSLKTSVAVRVIARWRLLRASILDDLRTSSGTLRFWQRGGGFDRNVRTTGEFCREVQYIHRNPVERGLVLLPEEWKWSSVRWWMGERANEWECDGPPGDSRFWSKWSRYK